MRDSFAMKYKSGGCLWTGKKMGQKEPSLVTRSVSAFQKKVGVI